MPIIRVKIGADAERTDRLVAPLGEPVVIFSDQDRNNMAQTEIETAFAPDTDDRR